ncbi:SdrD B-like domain-containing protein [Jiulongibacter sp. NS-SX5]|uniref:SdrD B-like domain-containing protein n=1 Tax=Jiulongibacter sp. NS-SX5 TaxID=3463854 RepID=UPI004058D3EC
MTLMKMVSRTSVSTCPATGCCAIIIEQGPYGIIGDFVWNDFNEDGIQDPGEPGISGIGVVLYELDGTGSVIDSDTVYTDTNGFYQFDSLLDGDYRVKLDNILAFSEFSPANAANDTLDSDFDINGETLVTISTLDAIGNPRPVTDINRVNNTIDGGFLPTDRFDLALSKDLVSGGLVEPGDTVTYTITVQNQGDSLATFINVTDRVPAGLTLVAGEGWTMADSVNATYDTEFSLAGGTSNEFPISFVVNAGTEGKTITNTAEITSARGQGGIIRIDDDSTPNNGAASEDDQDTAELNVSSGAMIGDYVWADEDGDGIQDGSESGLEGVLVTLELPDGTFVASTSTDSLGFYQFANLASGDYVVVFSTPSGYEATTPNQGGNDEADSDADPATGESPIINLTPGFNENSIDAGFTLQSVCYEITSITASNDNICVGDTVALTAISSNAANIAWYYSSVGGSPISVTASAGDLTVYPSTTTTYYAELTNAGTPGCPNQRVPVTVVVNAIPGTPTCGAPAEICSNETVDLSGFILNPLTVPGGVFEWHVANDPTSALVTDPSAVGAGMYYLFERSPAGCYSNAAIATITEKDCDELIDLSLIKIADNRNVETNDIVNYTIEVTNDGPFTATNVVIEDVLPEGLAFISSADFTESAGVLTHNIAALGVNETVFLTYSTRVTATTGSIINVAEVKSADQMDIDSTPDNKDLDNEDDDDDEIIIIVNGPVVADLSLQKLVNTTTPSLGDQVTYTIRVTNNGPENATNVAVEDILPAGVSYVTSTNSTHSNGVVTAQIASIASGTTAQFTITVTADSVGTFVNSAEVTAADQDDNDSTPDNGVNANEDDDDSVTITITEDCNPSTPIISANNSYVCQGDQVTLSAIGCSGTINWSNGMTGASINVSPVVTTTYTATCTEGSCTSDASNELTIVVDALAAPTVSANKSTICLGESVVLTATNCSGTVSWSNGSTTVGTGSSLDLTPDGTSSYTATCQSNTCVSPASSTVTVNVSSSTGAPVISASTQSICTGESVTLTASSCGGTVNWSNGMTGASITVSPTTTSTYSAICSVGSCTSNTSNTITIDVSSGETPTITASATTICAGTEVTLTASNCTSGIVWNTGATTSSIEITPSETSTYTVTCGTGSCAGSANETIIVNSVSSVSISASSSQICSGESVTLTASECSQNLTWSNGSTDASITVSPSATQSYSVTCSNGVCSTSAETTVTVGTGNPVTITASETTVCPGTQVTLTASGCTETVSWSTGETGNSISVSPTEQTMYTATCGTGVCAGTGSVTIEMGSGESPLITSTSDNLCVGESTTLSVSDCSGPISWSTGETTSSITVTPTQSTTYTIVCGTGSCSAIASKTIFVGSPVTPNITASQTTVCAGEEVTLSVDNCSQTLVWSTGVVNASITVNPTETTTYTAACGDACIGTNNITINVEGGAAPTISASATAICEPTDITLTASGCSGTVNWSNGMTGNEIIVSVSANTTFTAICSNGSCTSTNSNAVTVTVGGLQTPTITASGSAVCSGSDVTITAANCAGTVSWSNGMTGTEITVSPSVKTVYTAICQIGSCTSENSNPVEVDVIDSPNAPVISCSASRICQGEEITLNGLGCEGTVKWSTGQTGSSITVSPLETTVYTATCMIGSCESVQSAPATINVGNPFPPQVSCQNTLICLGSSTTLIAEGCVGTVEWSDGQIGSTITVSPTTMTSYSAVCKGETCQSEISNVVTIGVTSQSITAPTVTSLTNICPVETVSLSDAVTSSPSNGGSFVFRTANSPNSPAVSNPTAIASSGSFFVFEDGGDGCYSAGTQIDVAIIACESPVDCSINPATAFAGNDTTLCLSNDFIQLNGTIGGAAQTGTWTSTGSGTFDNSTSPVTRYNFSNDDIVNGSVVLTLTTNDPDGAGDCEAATSTMTVNVNAVQTTPTISTNKSPIICLGDSVVLTVDQTAAGYVWSTGDTSSSITVKTPGEYSVQLVNVDGCRSLSSAPTTVNTNSDITAPVVIEMATNACPATTVNLEDQVTSQPQSSGGVFSYHTGLTPDSPMLGNVSAMPAGDYYVFERTSTGCYSNPSLISVVINSCETNEDDAEVEILIVGDESSVTIGDEVVYTITVTNNGPDSATNVAIENQIPFGVQIVGETPGLTLNNDFLTATIPALAVNESTTFTYTGEITRSGVISNIAKIIAVDQTDPIKSNNISRFDVECTTCQEICIATALDAEHEQQENGSYNVTFTSLIENCGNVELDGVKLSFDMETMFGTTATYTMIQQPTANAGSALEMNTGFNGGSDQEVLVNTGSSIGAAQIYTVTWVINVVPNGDKGPFSGNAKVSGIGETIFGTMSEVDDFSNEGLFVERSSSTPTTVRLYKTPSIGIALAIIDTVRQGDESLNVTYQAIVKNNGALDLEDVIVRDDLAETYASPITYSLVGSPTVNTGSSLIVNSNYDGDTNDTLTLPGSTLAIGVSDTIWFTVNIIPNDKTEFSNSATAQGTGELEDTTLETVVDVSNTGYNPDAPGSQPTLLQISTENTESIQAPCIGAALYVAETETLEDGSIDVTYKAIIDNCGNVNLNGLQICDSLTANFDAPVAVVLKDAPYLNAGSTLAIDSTYDGINNVCMLDSANSSLAIGKTDTITWKINLTLNSNNGPFRKNVTVTAVTPADEVISDISNDGINPDPEGDAPTVLNFNNLPDDIIGIAKEVVSIETAGEDTYDVTFKFILKNYGIIDFTGVQIQDNLALTFGDKISIDSVRVFDASEGLTINENFTGKGLLIDLLVDSTSTLPRSTTKEVSLMTRVNLAEADTSKFENMALAIGYHNGTSTDDQSTVGNNPDPDSDGTPFNNSDPTPIDFGDVIEENVTPLGIAKAVTDTVKVIDGSYQLTYTLVVKNYGNETLTNIQLTDSLSSVFDKNTDFVMIGSPVMEDVAPTLQLNSSFDGVTDINFLVADSSSLAPGESDTLSFKVKVRNNGNIDITYNNTVYGSASVGTEIVTDMSHAGMNPDEDADNNPGNNNTTTALTLSPGENNTGNVAVLIPGGISPNGDGVNDNLVIEGVTEADELKIKIYNRWGELVFVTDNYKRLFPGTTDGWNGTANSGIRTTQEETKLPDGTYFYSVESTNVELFEGKPYYNYITISGGSKK